VRGVGSNLQSLVPYPVVWERTSALPQSPSSGCSTAVCPRTELVTASSTPVQLGSVLSAGQMPCGGSEPELGLFLAPPVWIRHPGQKHRSSLGGHAL